jgi:DNA repair protein NreA
LIQRDFVYMEKDFYGEPLTDLFKYRSPREKLLQQYVLNSHLKPLKKEMFGPSPPNMFVGRVGYPNVYVGPLVGIDESVNAMLYDDPKSWYGLPIEEIVKFRSSLVRGKKLDNVKNSRDIFDLQDSVLSQKTVDMEVTFKKTPSMGMYFHNVFQPMGPTAEYEKLRLASNPSIPKKVDSVIGEGILARAAFSELMSAKYDVYYLQKLLSAGLLGKEENRRLVPTRWGITAADRIAADIFIERIRNMKELNEIRLYGNEYLANHFEVLMLPGRWEYEQFENWEGGMMYKTSKDWFLEHEYEPYGGRSDYAVSEGGGYYAGRFSVAEFLATQIRRQARVVVIREIHKEYDIPSRCLGNTGKCKACF